MFGRFSVFVLSALWKDCFKVKVCNQLWMVLTLPDVSLLRFSPQKKKITDVNETFFIRDKYCLLSSPYIRLCLILISDQRKTRWQRAAKRSNLILRQPTSRPKTRWRRPSASCPTCPTTSSSSPRWWRSKSWWPTWEKNFCYRLERLSPSVESPR